MRTRHLTSQGISFRLLNHHRTQTMAGVKEICAAVVNLNGRTDRMCNETGIGVFIPQYDRRLGPEFGHL